MSALGDALRDEARALGGGVLTEVELNGAAVLAPARVLDAAEALRQDINDLIEPDIRGDIENGENTGGWAQVHRVCAYADSRAYDAAVADAEKALGVAKGGA